MWDLEGNIVDTKTVAKVTEQVITADEILRLNPQDRARMLDKENYNKYSDAQKAEIDKLKNQLVMKDPTILDDIQNQANLTQRIEANRRAYVMILENPEAAAYQLDSDMNRQALEAKAINFDRTVAKIADTLHKFYQQANIKGDDVNTTRNAIYKNLRVLNRDILDYMNDKDVYNSLGIGYMFKEVQDAIDWSDITSDISNIISYMDMEDSNKEAFSKNLDAILDKTETRLGVLNELGKVIESKSVEASAKVPFEILLNELEQIWDQRASTISMTREERVAAQEEHQRKLAEETQRRQEAEEAARAEAERKAAEAAAAGISPFDADTSGDRDAELAAYGLTDKDTTTDNESTLSPDEAAKAAEEGNDVNLESPTIEEQVAAEPDKVNIIPVLTDDSTDQGNFQVTTSGEYVGNTFYEYDIDSLKYHGKQVKRKGNSPDDIMSKIFNWLESAGIKLQDIIDTELSDILKSDHDVYPMLTDMRPNATNDRDVSKTVFLTVEYSSKVKNIHNNELGGIITSNGKQYLIIGIMGSQKGNNAQKGEVFEIMKDMQVKRKKAFDANPSERFFVDRSRHTKAVGLTAGRLVRQLTTDSEVQIRTISELLADKTRNPKGLTLEDLKWGIQYNDKMYVVNVSDRNTVYPPSDGASNLGSVFLLIESANGNYIPAYIRPIRLSELGDGKLKTQLNDLINELTSTDYAKRHASIKKLNSFLHLTREDNDISIGTAENPTVSIVKGGSVIRTFNLADANFDRPRLLESITELDPRVNITTSTLSDASLLEMFDEAGALTTDLAKLGTSGASYNVYAMDADGNPIITAPVESHTPTLEAGSDLTKAQKKMSSERMGNATYRKDANGNWYTETDKLVTDPRLIEQLNYRNLIRTRDLKPNKTIGIDEIFVINRDKDNPLVLIRRRGSQISAMSKKGALKTIIEINTELEEKARQERLQKELETEASNDEFLRNMSEKDKQKVAAEGEDVDGILTDEQIVEQMIGNFESEVTPQQEAVEELTEEATTDNVVPTINKEAPIVKSEPVKTGEDINKTGSKSLAELQSDKQTDTALSILKSTKDGLGKRARTLLKAKFPDMPSKTSELERFLQSKGIATTGITDVEQWLQMIEECK